MLNAETGDAPTFALISPIDGVIARHANKAQGELIAEGETIYTILNREKVHLHGMIPENSVLASTAVADVDCVVGKKEDERFKALGPNTGRLLAIGGEVDPETRTYSIHIETPNANGRLRINQRVSLEIAVGEPRQAVAVPESALIEEDGGLTIYVQASGELFEKRVVQTGVRDGGWIEIISGVQEGERVVSAGAYAVRLASLGGGAVPHGHHH